MRSLLRMPCPFQEMFRGSDSNAPMAFNGDVSSWQTSRVEEMTNLFHGCAHFSSNLSGWNVSQVRSTRLMFTRAESFTSDLSRWDVSKVTDFGFMFREATLFKSDLGAWDTSQASYLGWMFAMMPSLGPGDLGDLNRWDTSRATDMRVTANRRSRTLSLFSDYPPFTLGLIFAVADLRSC